MPPGGSDERGTVTSIDETLERVLEIDGVVAASLLESTTGLVLASARVSEVVDPSLVASAATDIVRLLGDMAARLGLEDELEDVVVTLRGRYHILRLVGGLLPEPVILVATLERPEANLAMAHLELREVGAQIGE
jgi:predicted regulator of Ras-like GTPase activity (Roadblock/LC7/MglB family)